MKYIENTIVELKVARIGDIGAFLDAQTGSTADDILLHPDQQTEVVQVGDVIRVFLYHDPKGRLTASMRLPRIQVGQIAYVTVINKTRFGAFVDLGTERGIFMPFAEMKGNLQVGEQVWIKLYEDKSGRLAVTMNVSEEMNALAKPAQGIQRGDQVTVAIYDIIDAGALGITPKKNIVFIHKIEWDHRLRVGEKLTARVTYVREDGRLNASLRQTKEVAITEDAKRILAYLESKGGQMAYNDASTPAVIRQQFGLTKAAFKRALGHLMKENLIRQTDSGTELVER